MFTLKLASRGLTAKALALLFLLALSLPAQTGLGTVHGTVMDSSRAILANAKANLTNTDTGVAQTVQTTTSGVFYFGAVKPGPYKLTVEFDNFKRWTGTFILVVGQNALIDPVMEVGSLQASVEVSGAAPIIETEKGTVSDVKDALRIHELPLNGRQITNLFNLTAGVEGGANPRTNGMKLGATEMVLDGISLVDRFTGGMAQVQPGLDTVQEFRFETAGSDAQYSRPATVTLATKSGSNDLHGNLFVTHRNNFGGLRARQRMDKSGTPPKYIRNEYGGTASGPIKKNKLFWLFSDEGMKLRQQNYAEAQLPSPSIWGGDFAGAMDPGGPRITIYDPLTSRADGTRSPFPGNIIPSGQLAKIASVMKGLTPLATDTTVNPWTSINFKTYYPNTQDYNTQTVKVDYFSAKDTFSVRYTRSDQKNVRTGGRWGYPPHGCSDCFGTLLGSSGLTSIVARENHVFSPTFLNEFQASVNRSPNHQGQLSDFRNWANELGFPNPFAATGWPSLYTSDWWFFFGGGWDAGNPKDQQLTQYQLEDNVTWIKGKHNAHFGFRGRLEQNNVREMAHAMGSHGFYGEWTTQFDPVSRSGVPYTGDGLAAMLLGLPSELWAQYNRGYYYFRQKEFGLYFQDSWRVSDRLTLNYGVRWDKWTPYHEKYNRMVNFDPFGLSPTGMNVITPGDSSLESMPDVPPSVLQAWKDRGLTSTTANQAGFPSSLLPGVSANFAPRVGLAYRFGNNLVVRASYGVYYWPMPLAQLLQSSRTNPPLNLDFGNMVATHNDTNHVYGKTVVPASTDYLAGASIPATAPNGARQFTAFDPNRWADDRMQQWTFNLERQLGKNDAVRLSYIGNHGSNLEQRWAYNDATAPYNYRAATGLIGSDDPNTRRLNPNWSGQAVRHDGYSNTQTLQAEFQHRSSKGLTFQGFYTWAHAMSTTDAGGNSSGDGNTNGSGSGYAFLVPMNGNILGNPHMSDSDRLRLGYTNSGDVPPQHIRWNGVYDLPFGKGKRFGGAASGLLNHLIGGWSVGFVGEWRSGYWMGVDSGFLLLGDPTLSKDERVLTNIFGKQQQLYFRGYFDPAEATSNQDAILRLVPADFSKRALTKIGNNDNRVAQRLANGTVVQTSILDGMINPNSHNFLQGPGMWNEDLSIYKTVTLKEKYKLRLTGDFFNAFNHPNSVNPNNRSGLLDLSQQSNDPRIIQFSAKFEF